MRRGVMPAFRKFHAEAAFIGRMLAGYGELEVDLCNCIAMGGVGTDTATKAMFKPRGETARINKAEQLGVAAYQNSGLTPEFGEAIMGMRHCLSIRNQYAHCQWYDDYSDKLAFTNLEEIAHLTTTITDYRGLQTRYVDVALLTQQESYFALVDEAFAFVNYEGRKKAGTLAGGHIFVMPDLSAQPPLHM